MQAVILDYHDFHTSFLEGGLRLLRGGYPNASLVGFDEVSLALTVESRGGIRQL